ncbi:MAG: 23S rRNA (pseudouridine(1915)-N(3))-methyltransferase RlmH [Clostridia bacterium]|jgi:23S rRNA (pseudouridine1915-N3)-methyltransferase|nr:23S rRNA (pseudouridine(1915)-N(3))-methyltransferase RlmH [Clostridia bacterium]
MRIHLVAVGRLKEKYLREGISEYAKRLSGYCSLEITEVPDEQAPEKMSSAQEEQVKNREGERILRNVKEDSFVIALDIQGKMLSSDELSDKLASLALCGKSHVTLIIGGSLGLSTVVLARANFSLSFSPMTFPHQLMRLILLEQLYRAFKINRGEPYHK